MGKDQDPIDSVVEAEDNVDLPTENDREGCMLEDEDDLGVVAVAVKSVVGKGCGEVGIEAVNI